MSPGDGLVLLNEVAEALGTGGGKLLSSAAFPGQVYSLSVELSGGRRVEVRLAERRLAPKPLAKA